MPLYESDSIILKTYPLAEADRIVVFFSRNYGKIRGVANGVRRTKSRFGASLEPLAQSKVTFFQKETVELVRIRSSELIDFPTKLLEDYDRTLLGVHTADLVDRFLPEHEAHDAVFRLFNLARKSLSTGIPPQLVRCYFEVWMLRLAGVLPEILTCSACRRRLRPVDARYLLPGLTRVACAECPREGSTRLPPETVESFHWILSTPLDAEVSPPPGAGLGHIQQLNKLWMDRYFER